MEESTLHDHFPFSFKRKSAHSLLLSLKSILSQNIYENTLGIYEGFIAPPNMLSFFVAHGAMGLGLYESIANYLCNCKLLTLLSLLVSFLCFLPLFLF